MSSTSIDANIGGLVGGSDPFLDVIYPPSNADVNSPQSSLYLPRCLYRVRVFHPFEHLSLATALNEIKTEVGSLMNVGRSRNGVSDLPSSQRRIFFKFQGSAANVSPLSDIRALWWRPMTSILLHSATLNYTSFAPAVRLSKMWCASQLFPLDQMNDLIEHLVFHLFNHPTPHSHPPTTPHVAFAR